MIKPTKHLKLHEQEYKFKEYYFIKIHHEIKIIENYYKNSLTRLDSLIFMVTDLYIDQIKYIEEQLSKL